MNTISKPLVFDMKFKCVCTFNLIGYIFRMYSTILIKAIEAILNEARYSQCIYIKIRIQCSIEQHINENHWKSKSTTCINRFKLKDVQSTKRTICIW